MLKVFDLLAAALYCSPAASPRWGIVHNLKSRQAVLDPHDKLLTAKPTYHLLPRKHKDGRTPPRCFHWAAAIEGSSLRSGGNGMPAHDVDAISSAIDSAAQPRRPFWPEGWWRLVDFRIGIVPLPVYVLLIGLVAALVALGEIRSDAPTMIVVLVLGGFTCAEIGKRLPVLRNIGAGAIFATFIPSALAYYHLIPTQVETSIIEFTKSTNFLYLFIASIIVGSIFAMDRDVLIRGFLKIFVPLAVGSVVAATVGTLVGTVLGLARAIPSSMSWYRSWQVASARVPFHCRLDTPP
jgi:hypothetical protein